MATAASIRVVSPASKLPDLELRNVFGTGREGRWETVQQLFREQIEPLYGAQGNLLKELPESETLKTRLLVAEKEPVGVLVYKTAKEDPHQKQLGRYLEIKVLHGDEKRPDARNFLLDHLLDLAKEHKIDSLCIRTSKQAPLIPFLGKNGFQVMEEKDGLVLYSRKIENLSNGSRKRKTEDDKSPLEGSRGGKEEKPDRPKLSPSSSSRPSAEPSVHLSPNSAKGDPLLRRPDDDEGQDYKRSRNDKGEKQGRSPEPAPYRPPSVSQLKQHFEPSPAPTPASRMIEGIPRILSSKVIAENKLLLERAKKETRDNIPLKMVYLKPILDGRKTIEGRINNGPFQRLKEGNFIRFHCQSTEAYCLVTKVTKYSSFAEMLQTEGIKPCLPDVNSLQEGIRIYDSIPGYADKANRFGVLAIHIRVLR